MALRLTDATPSPEEDPKPASLGARAQQALSARDVPAYLALFAEAAAVEDVHRRYEARKDLLEAGLATGGSDIKGMGTVFAAVARGALDALASDPREPVLLNYAGIAFYELGELGPAEELFRAANRLDPDLPHVERNIEEIARRRRQGLTHVKLPPPLRMALKDLGSRAKKIARQAQPAEGMTLSLCMIVKDEEAMLGRMLSAVRDWVDEIVVVDTGSRDRTVEIAESFGAKVLHHEWTGDFSEARNVSVEAATGDWIIYLDADEILVDGDGPRLRALLGRTWREAYYVVMTNFVGDEEDGHAMNFNALRMFRNREEYRFEGRLHEQWAHNLPAYLPERLVIADVRIDHFGYLGVVRDEKGKSRRNLELLERQAAEGDDSAFLHFNIGSEHMAVGEDAVAAEEFALAWERVRGEDGRIMRLGFVPSLAARYVRALHVTGRLEDLHAIADEALERLPGFTDIVLERALAVRDAGDHAEAERLLRACLELGDAPSHYSAAIGAGTYLPRLALAELMRAAGRLDEAEAEVRHCLAEHATFIGVVEPYATVRLANGATPAQVTEELHAALPEMVPGARFLLAAVLHEAGAADLAEEELRAVVAAQPGSALARLALSEALLSQARFADAVAVLEAIEADSPWAPQAARSIAFAALAEGDVATARTALERDSSDRIPAGERALLRAWSDAAAGDEPAPSLPADAAGTALVMLEALARVEAFEAFELLAGRYETIDVPARERREGLAALYLRRGFLESAADEWIAACESDGVDAAALLGLAQVAWARGMDDDAVVFAQEARELEPDHSGAARLLEHLGAAA
ncbi:MAG TPA: glycosyltransferase [Solirubrobacteraceae bacterium]